MSVPNRVALGDVATIERKVIDAASIEDQTLYVGLGNIESGGRLVGVRPVNAGELRSSKFIFTPNHLLFGKLRPYLAKIARPDFCGVCSTDILPVLPGPSLDRSFLAWLLLSPSMVATASAKATGTNLPRLSPEALADLKIPCPPISEQKRIAMILDKADKLTMMFREMITRLDSLAQSLFIEMFGDPATNPKGWPLHALGELFEIARGGSPRPINDYLTDGPDGVNWIMISDAREGSKYIVETNRRITPVGAKRSRGVKPGDLLLTNSMSFGRPHIMKTSGYIHDGWLVLSPRSADVIPDYFYGVLSSRALYMEFERLAPGATVKNLNIGLVRNVAVPVPTVAKQREYSDRVRAIETLIAPIERSLGSIQDFSISLQHRALRGEH